MCFQHKYFSLLAGAVLLTLWLPVSGHAEPVKIENSKVPGVEDPRFFPIGVWLQDPKLATRYKKFGINLYVGLWNGPTARQLATLKRAKMRVISVQNDTALSDTYRDIIFGWSQIDEPDNAQKNAQTGKYDRPIPPKEIVRRYNRIRLRDPNRPVFMNLGQGVAWNGWHGRGARSGHLEDYREYVKGADIVSFDIYPVTHPNPNVSGRLEFIHKGISRLRKWAPPQTKIWNVVGVTRIKNRHKKPSPEEIWSQVWMSIASGSEGIIYFVHKFSPKFNPAAILQDPSSAMEVKKINGIITGIAPALNSPQIPNFASAKFAKRGAGIITRAHLSECSAHLVTASIRGTPGTVRHKIAVGTYDEKVEVLGEDRTLLQSNGEFKDFYGRYGAHVYKLQSTAKHCRG